MPRPGDSAPNQRRAPGASKQNGGWSARAWMEIALMTIGLALLATFCGVQIDSYLSSRSTLKEFSAHRSAAAIKSGGGAESAEGALSRAAQPRQGSEPPGTSVEHHPQPAHAAAVAVLRIPRIQLEVPVLEGTDALTLHRGVGWIKGTARPGETGNVGIAGHRDTFFRSLKDLKMNDTINLEMPDGRAEYIVDRIQIVPPEDVSVLNSASEPVLTLVTCYPFRFVGSAPKRYVVTARLVENKQNIQSSPSALEELSTGSASVNE